MTTSSPPPEAPHYNGNLRKSLSPTSPKPIHAPDLNIPVLQNQIDPHFNLMSTHMATPHTAQYPYDNSSMQSGEGTVQQDIQAGNGVAANGGQVSVPSHVTQDHHLRKEGNDGNNSAVQSNQPAASVENDASASTYAQTNYASYAQNQQQQSEASDTIYATEIPSVPADKTEIQENAASVAPQEPPQTAVKSPSSGLNVDTGNIQALLDNLIASNAPTENSNAPTSGSPSATAAKASSPGDSQTSISALPTPAGLPPRPPPQIEPSIHPNYTPGQSLRSYHNPPPPTNAQNPSAQTHSSYRPSQNQPSSNVGGPNGLAAPPNPTFRQPADSAQPSPQDVPPQQLQHDQGAKFEGHTFPAEEEAQQFQQLQDQDQAYQDFLRVEAGYVAEGTWDRFPQGSRLFVGNLFTEKVAKRDIWDIFSKYGNLAQISMKNAYGFVQFIEPGASDRAMHAEEGTEVGGRKIHLEISKPQKNTRNANAGDRARGGHSRRSRSPDYGRGHTHAGMQRPASSSYGGYDRRGRDDYRPRRSPSPRGARGYDNRGIDRYYPGQRSRSRSPYGRAGQFRERSPPVREITDEPSLPIPRRNPVQVPDVQIIIIDESDRTFVAYIQQSFRDRGLRCDVLQLPKGVTLPPVVRRQALEGVRAVVNIYRKSQVTGKIPMQLFDRSHGMHDVRFDDYHELDATVAADIVAKAKQAQPVVPIPAPQYPPNQGYGQPPHTQPPVHHIPQQNYPSQAMHGQQPPPPNLNPGIQNPLSSLDGQTLQKLLGSLNQNPPTTPAFQDSPQQQQPPQDLATLLSAVARQTPQQPQSGYQPPQPQTPAHQGGYPPYQGHQPHPQQRQYPQQQQSPTSAGSLANNPLLTQLLSRPQGQQSMPPQQGGQQYQRMHQQPPAQQQHQNVQDIMAQLAKYRQ